MRQQRERRMGRQPHGTPKAERPSATTPGAERETHSAPQPESLDQAPTVRATAQHVGVPSPDATLRPLDESRTTLAQVARMRTSGPTAGRRTSAPPGSTLPTQALAPLKTDGERGLAKASVASETTTLIPGARRYRPPAVSVVPRRSGPRSALTQFAVSMLVTAILISALTLSTPLGQAAALDVNGPVRAYSNAAPWIPTPTPTPKPKPASSFRPPAGANPGQQAVINEIISVFGPYAQGALGVSKCESGYDPNAWNSYPILNSHASGVFQILYPSTWNTTSYASSSPFDASANIHAAYQIFKRDGYSWREWQCQP
ncbi:MAG TPA: hypothetical protein VFN78_08080 [Ktedonobacterales bacterium]|nr:hypothetical protein [Ktedonobacterales bacterium]